MAPPPLLHSPIQRLPIIALSILFPILPFAAPAAIHDLLREYGLPAGLLPKEVESFTLDQSNGLLEVRLAYPCFAKYDGLAYFDQVVTGNLSYGELKAVEGWQQEELFLWLPVKGILVSNPSSGVILFDIGLAHKQLSLSLFENPPDCRPEREKVVLATKEGFLGRKGGIIQQQR